MVDENFLGDGGTEKVWFRKQFTIEKVVLNLGSEVVCSINFTSTVLA